MKKILCTLLAAAMLTAFCSCDKNKDTVSKPESPAASQAADINQFKFTRENFPSVDGSTSMVPLGEAVASVLLGESNEDVKDLIKFNRTSQSFRNLMNGKADILIVAEPAENVLEELKQNNFEYDKAHISTDALIFVVNADNPVNSLTTEQIRKIYSGEITNWSQVGGNDVKIMPFQRNEEAGSQAAMKRLIMKDLPFMEGPKGYIVDSMSGLMDAVREFDGSNGAIGYSVYYYANDMRMAEGLKIIAVDGVDPNPDTIRAEKYPHLAKSYTVVAKSAEENSPERIMYNWLQSDDGQKLIGKKGYVSVKKVD